jgi:molecular chaperone DnaK
VKEAASHAGEDQARRELIDARNQADSLAYQAEKTVAENKDRLPAGDVAQLEAAIAEARKAGAGEDLAAIKKATEDLQRAAHAIGELLYKGSSGSSGSSGSNGSTGSSGSGVKDAEVVDAEYSESV